MTDEKRLAAKQWLAKADNDWTTVEILLKSERSPADSICFHCQQYVEKPLKALLTANGVECPRTHDIRRLVVLAEPLVCELGLVTEASDLLTEHGVRTRYPDECRAIKNDELSQVVELAREFGRILRSRVDG